MNRCDRERGGLMYRYHSVTAFGSEPHRWILCVRLTRLPVQLLHACREQYRYVSIKSIGKWGVLDLSPVGRHSRIHTFEKYRIVLSINNLVLKICTWQVPLKSIKQLYTSSVLTFWARDSVGDPRVSKSCATRKAVTTELS